LSTGAKDTVHGPAEIAHYLPPHYLESELRRDVLAGLTAEPKSLPPKWFYDDRGSKLFERIMELPEYYLSWLKLVCKAQSGDECEGVAQVAG